MWTRRSYTIIKVRMNNHSHILVVQILSTLFRMSLLCNGHLLVFHSACILSSCGTALQFQIREWLLPRGVQSWSTVSQGDLLSSSHVASQGGPIQLLLWTETAEWSCTGIDSQLEQIHPSCNTHKIVLWFLNWDPWNFLISSCSELFYQLFFSVLWIPCILPKQNKRKQKCFWLS